ncbi:F-box DNA helicase 1-like [Paramuricea clavata]|uniref:DNA 3'-5' helicase n=1 Tax=Paramuricea clavata TaxID=317549 RepID=A0A7D9D9C2_PARCT|nr:F-box DNA helicase 1-like [Paramuricea clavata]
MTTSGSKGRKRRRYNNLDDSQKSIKLFCVWNTDHKNTKSQNKLRPASSETVSKITSKPVARKKQTLLAPFDKTNNPNCFKIKKMDCWNSKSNGSNFVQIENDGCINHSEEIESELQLIDCCERAELSLSQEKQKCKNDNVRSSLNDCHLSQTENIGRCSDNELEIIECCERAELSLSQEKLKRKNDNVRSSPNDCNLSQTENIGGPSDNELEIIECCERAELSLSQEKLKRRNGNVRSSPNDCDLSQTENIGAHCSDSELEIIECCERAELSLSEKKLKHRKERKSKANFGNFSQTKCIFGGCSSSEERESEIEIIECCDRAELSLSKEKLKHRKSVANDDTSVQNENIFGGCSSSKPKDPELEIVYEKAGSNVRIKTENVQKSNGKTSARKRQLLPQFNKNASATSNLNYSHQAQPRKTNSFDDFDIEENDLEILEVCRKAELSASQTSLPPDKKARNSPNMFGLFGITSSDEEDMDVCFDKEMENFSRRAYFNEIPDEILETIFCQLPLIDLLTNLSLVCKRWNRLISCEKFLLWKKRYYRYKYSFESRKEIDDLFIQEQLNVPSIFPSQLFRFLTKFRIVREEHSNMLDMLCLHSKYHLIEKFMQQSDIQQPYSCWSVIGLLSLVSSSVYDIQEIILCSFKSSTCLLYDIMECLHCLALIFFALMEKHPNHFTSHHYRIYYALYLHENTSHCTQSSLESAYTANTSGQQCISKYRESSETTWLTHEQVRIMNHNTKYGDVLKIVAFAGTGKTTTLVEYTKLRPSWKFLNVAYNKSVQEQAVRKFPGNVESRTVHSMAYRTVGHKFRGKMASSLRVSNIMDNLRKESATFLHAKRVIDTLTNFISSYDDHISSENVPHRDIASGDSDGDRSKLEYFNSDAYIKIVVRDCREIWDKMRDPENRDVRITHDGYLKLYQLSKPVITKYDCILVDEAQDCTPAVADILLSQKVAKILVGDPHQQIYGFRGATNAMAQVDSTHIYYLTQSFRFGSEIASVASSLLHILKGVCNKNIVGISKAGGFHGDHIGQIAVICRTNFALFNNVVQTCTRNNKTRIGFAGGIQGYNLDRVLDIHMLYSGTGRDGIKDKFIKRFRTFAELKKYACTAPDPELCGKIKIVETHNINVRRHVERIKKQYCNDVDQAEIVFSTAHKAKGLEFDTVRIGEDFLSDYPVGELGNAPNDEKNLLYVAVTRAKLRLQCSTMLYSILALRTDLLVTCESLKSVQAIESTYCAECKRRCDFTESMLAMKRAQVVLGTAQKMEGGFLCSRCILKCIPYMENLLVSNKNSEAV